MGVKLKVLLRLDSSNFGCLMRLVEDGTITSLQLVNTEASEESTARDFAAEVRAAQNGTHRSPRPRVIDGLRMIDCVLAILQSKPDHAWHSDEVGVSLDTDYGWKRTSAPSALARLTNHGYTERVSQGTYQLTDKGKAHSQTEPLPTSVNSPYYE